MTELETLFIRNNRQLRNDIAAAVDAEMLLPCPNTRRNWTTRSNTAPLSWRARPNGVSLGQQRRRGAWDGEYDLEENSCEVEQHDDENEYWDYDCDV